MRKVVYKMYYKNIRDEEWGDPIDGDGNFLAFTPDYKKAVIETVSGEVIHVPIERMRFVCPNEEMGV